MAALHMEGDCATVVPRCDHATTDGLPRILAFGLGCPVPLQPSHTVTSRTTVAIPPATCGASTAIGDQESSVRGLLPFLHQLEAFAVLGQAQVDERKDRGQRCQQCAKAQCEPAPEHHPGGIDLG